MSVSRHQYTCPILRNVCLHVCWAGREHRSTVSHVCMFANGRASGHQCEHVIYVPLLVVAAVYMCVTAFWCASQFIWRGSPIHPFPSTEDSGLWL